MKEIPNDDEKLRVTLKENGLPKPSTQFSNHLQNFIADRYAKNRRQRVTKHLWPARVVVVTAIFWGLIFLYLFNPFKGQPVLCLSVVAFAVGLWMEICLIKRQLPLPD